jgi:hypothetical protein
VSFIKKIFIFTFLIFSHPSIERCSLD